MGTISATTKRVEKIAILLEELLENRPLVIVDGGARGGTLELPRLAAHCRVFGFEPHPIAFQTLQQQLKRGDHLPYRSLQYFPEALAEEPGERSLHLAENPSYSSFLEVDWETYERHLSFMPRFREWQEDIAAGQSVDVPTTTLDQVVAELGLPQVDLLKLDTQGTELRILQGGEKLLNRAGVGVVKCEVSFISFYKNQCLFADIDHYLRDHGFEYVDCRFDFRVSYELPARGFAGRSPLPALNDPIRYTAGGDAVYFHLPEQGDSSERQRRALRTGLVLAAMGYLSPAYHLWRRHEALPPDDAERLLRCLAHRSLRQRLRRWAERWSPPALLGWWRGG